MGRPQAKSAREGVPVRYSARVEYDGTEFAGFQIQPNGRTVQGELERVLVQISDGQRMRVDGAGRTDAGVHARGQVIAFTYAGSLGPEALEAALNGLLPADVSVSGLRRVHADFLPRYRARHREYRYRIWNATRSPLVERFAYGVRDPLDVERMREAAAVFVGRHDFSPFGGKDRQPVRTLHLVDVRRRGALITIVVVGDAFLKGMVRRIVAALIRVGKGQRSVADVRAALEARTPAFKGEAAPARGLTLWNVPMGPERNTKQANKRTTGHENNRTQ
jgi:tRNA pseudouridine38-40 synthase